MGALLQVLQHGNALIGYPQAGRAQHLARVVSDRVGSHPIN
jgi:hypothetical protein